MWTIKKPKMIFVDTNLDHEGSNSSVCLEVRGNIYGTIREQNISDACKRLLPYVGAKDIMYVNIKGFGMATADFFDRFRKKVVRVTPDEVLRQAL